MEQTRKEKIIVEVRKFYSSYKVKEIDKILTRTNREDKIQEFLKAKAKIDVLTANIQATSQSERCVAFIRDNPHNKVINFFLVNLKFKPAGLTTTVQLAFLCITDWKQHREKVLNILEFARVTKIPDREVILHAAGYKNTPLLFIWHLLKQELGLDLFKTKSTYYNGYNIKQKDIYDAEAQSA